MLKDVIRSNEGKEEGSDLEKVLRDLEGVSGELNIKLEEIRSLYAQDKHNYFGDVEVRLVEESLTLDRAIKLVEEIKSRQSDKLLETSSRLSRYSRRSKSSADSSTTSSAARMKALAEAAAARESAEFERMVAEKERKRRKREAEIERTRQQERAEHEKVLAIIAAGKKVAIAHAKLKAIE